MDEWQDVPQIWDAARRHIDDNANRKGQLILTGSAIPAIVTPFITAALVALLVCACGP